MDPAAIRRLRAHLNVNQSAFAALLGVSRISVSNWENGKQRPMRPYLMMLRELADKTYGPLIASGE